MARKPSLDPALRALIDQAAELKKQQRADRAPMRAHRHKLAAAISSASATLNRARIRLANLRAPPTGLPWDGQLFPWKLPLLIADAELVVQEAERALASRRMAVELFDELHRAAT